MREVLIQKRVTSDQQSSLGPRSWQLSGIAPWAIESIAERYRGDDFGREEIYAAVQGADLAGED